jgi:hypothetical protein
VEETEKNGFFKKLKISIFNLERYSIFTKEKFFEAFKYLLKLLAIVTVVLSISSTIVAGKGVNKIVNYIENEFPDFTIEDGKLTVEENVEAYDSEYDAKLIVDTKDEVSDEEISAYEKKAKESTNSIILLKESAIYYINGEKQEAKYSDFLDFLGIDSLDKAGLVTSYFNQSSLNKFYVEIWVTEVIMIFMLNFLNLVEDVLIVAIFGIIAVKLNRVKLKFSQTASIAVHSLTLSIIISAIYSVVNAFTGFEIKYFEAMYMIIAYIYLVASIMMMKDDINKSVSDVVTVEGQVIKTVDENSNDKSEDENEDDKKDEEPKDGDTKDNSKDDLNSELNKEGTEEKIEDDNKNK